MLSYNAREVWGDAKTPQKEAEPSNQPKFQTKQRFLLGKHFEPGNLHLSYEFENPSRFLETGRFLSEWPENRVRNLMKNVKIKSTFVSNKEA